MKSLYGFTKPYNFKRAFPFLVATTLLFLIICVMAAVALFGDLSWATYRFVYFLYIGLLALTAAALSFAPGFVWTLIVLCFIEFSLGTGTSVLKEVHILKSSLLPLDLPIGLEPRFRYHPLLQGTPTPNYFPSLPFRIQHDSYGLRGPERDKDRLARQIVIATVGGSTTYDIGVQNGETWSDALERDLGDEYAVLNHGVPGYTTVENLIQTLFYLDSYDVRPRCAVYYVGWNDLRNAHLPNLDRAYADFHLLSQPRNLDLQKDFLLAKLSPLGKILLRYLQAWLEIIPMPNSFADQAPEQGSDIRLEKIFRTNLKAIVMINNERGITSIFVGQVVNRAALQQTTRFGWLPLVRDVDVWPLQERFNTILENTANGLHPVPKTPS